MTQVKQDSSTKVLVRLFDVGGSPVSGIAYGSVTAAVSKADQSQTTLTLSAGDWYEAAGGFSSSGVYWLSLPASATSVPGQLAYRVSATGAVDFVGIIDVVTVLEADTYVRIGVPTGASLAADLAATRADVGTVADDVWEYAMTDLTTVGAVGTSLRAALRVWLNRVKIDGNTKQLKVYAEDGVTVALTYDLKDLAEQPTATNPTERVPA